MKNQNETNEDKITEALLKISQIASPLGIKFICVTDDDFSMFKNFNKLSREEKDEIIDTVIGEIEDSMQYAFEGAQEHFKDELGELFDE